MTDNQNRKTEIKIGLAIVGVFLIYALWNARLLISGPQLEVTSPTEEITIVEGYPVITIIGTAKHGISELSINGGKSFVNQEGQFIETYSLSSGENRFMVVAKDKFGREIIVERTVWMVPKDPIATLSPTDGELIR